MRRLGLKNEDAQDQKRWRGLSSGNRLTLLQCGKEEVVRYGLRSHEAKR